MAYKSFASLMRIMTPPVHQMVASTLPTNWESMRPQICATRKTYTGISIPKIKILTVNLSMVCAL